MRESPELCAVSDNESGVGADVDSDDVVDAVDSEAVVDAVDSEAVPVADSDEEPDDVDDEPDDDLEEPVSVGSANAIAGVLAMAAPTPSAKAKTLARTRCCASAGIALRGEPARAPGQPLPEPTWSARWKPGRGEALLATFWDAGRRCLAVVVDLRCDLLMALWCPLCRPRDNLSCSGWRGYWAGVCSRGGASSVSPRGPQPAPGPIWVDRWGSRPARGRCRAG